MDSTLSQNDGRDSRDRARELLYVTYSFPPRLAGGTVRSSQTTKYLQDCNWRPTILTVEARNAEALDGDFAERGIEVLRASNPVKEDMVRGRSLTAGKSAAAVWVTRALKGLARWLFVPDRCVFWARAAEKLAKRAAARHDWQVVYASLYPISGVWVGSRIARALGLPFVLEYRDILADDQAGPTFLHRRLARSIERGFVATADRIVVVSEMMKEWACRKYAVEPERVCVVTNGFCPEEREAFRSLAVEPKDRLTAIYAGTFQGGRSPDVLLSALRELLERRPEIRDKLEVKFFSNIGPSVPIRYGLEGVVSTSGLIPRRQLLAEYAAADVLLLICGKTAVQAASYPGKVFEYLMTGKSILALVDKGTGLARMLEQSGLARIVDAEDVGEIAEGIEDNYDQWASGRAEPEPNVEFIEQFNRLRLVEKLVRTFDEAISAHSRKHRG